MSRRCESGFRPAFDRPLRRLAWVAPASLCLWILVLVGFSFLLGKIDQQPTVQPLEVSLADLSAGIPGGSPGGHPGPAGDGGAGGNAADRSLLPAPHALAPRPLNHAPLVTEPPIPTAAPRQRRRPARPAMRRKVEAAATVAVRRTRPDTRAELEDDNAPEPAFLKPRAVAAPAPAPPPSTPTGQARDRRLLTPRAALVQPQRRRRVAAAMATVVAQPRGVEAEEQAEARAAGSEPVRNCMPRWSIRRFRSPGCCPSIRVRPAPAAWRGRWC